MQAADDIHDIHAWLETISGFYLQLFIKDIYFQRTFANRYRKVSQSRNSQLRAQLRNLHQQLAEYTKIYEHLKQSNEQLRRVLAESLNNMAPAFPETAASSEKTGNARLFHTGAEL